MSDLDQIDNLHTQMEAFLKAVARKLPTPNQAIHLRLDFKNSLKVSDKNKQSYNVDESLLSTFRETYTDKTYKSVRLLNPEFEIDFECKRIKRIALIAQNVTFVGSKTQKKQISGCVFKVNIVEKEDDLKKFSPDLNGYLNRLGKRHQCSYSHNIAKELESLASFIPVAEAPKTNTFNYKPYVKPGSQSLDPLSTLNNEGKKVLEKLRHFVSRQQIYDFIVEQEVSEEAQAELRKLAMGGR